MSIVAYTEGVMASDSLTVDGNGLCRSYLGKIKKGTDFVIGFVGSLTDVETFWRSHNSMAFEVLVSTVYPDDRWKDLGIMVADAEGRCFEFDDRVFVEIEEPFCAMGSGRDYALGVLSLGATPMTAVQTAIRFDAYCGGEVQRAYVGDLDESN